MPPRGARGGRGRGRGRGTTRAAPSAAPDEGSSSQAPNIDVVMEDVSSKETTSATTDSHASLSGSAPTRTSSRFKPKNVRRDAAERAKLEEERRKELAAKLAVEEKQQRDDDRRARRGRGRGDRGQRGFIRGSASGPFSAAAREMSANSARGWGGGFGAGGSGGGGGGGGGASSSKTNPALEFNSRYKPRREGETRLNIEEFSMGSFSEGSPYNLKPIESLPFALPRTRHEEIEIRVKTTAELEAEERQSSDDEKLVISQAAKDISDIKIGDDLQSPVKVKSEPGTELDAMDVDLTDIPPVLSVPPVTADGSDIYYGGIPKPSDNDAAAQEKREKMVARDPELAAAAAELKAHQRFFLSGSPADGEIRHPGEVKQNDCIYLFQVPPIMPPLVNVTDNLTGEADSTSLAPQNNGLASDKVKTEEGIEKEKEKAPNRFPELPPEGGRIGKLNVRKSGKVEMDWGGFMMEVAMTPQSSMLTTAMLTDQNIDPAASNGTAYGMGEVAGRFCVVPIWSEEEEWNPSLEGIEGLE